MTPPGTTQGNYKAKREGERTFYEGKFSVAPSSAQVFEVKLRNLFFDQAGKSGSHRRVPLLE